MARQSDGMFVVVGQANSNIAVLRYDANGQLDPGFGTGGSSATVALDGTGSDDPDGDDLTYTWTGDFAEGGGTVYGEAPNVTLALGTHTVTLTVDDGNGEMDTDTVEVTVVDMTPPTVDAGPDATVEATSVAGAPYDVAAQATASDTCCAVSVSVAGLAVYPLGDTVVTVTATDCEGNQATDTMTVSVVDTTPPVLTVPPDVTVTATGPLTAVDIGTATATDLFGPVAITNDAPAAYPPGTTEVTWTATDANGNPSTAVQQVMVVYAFSGFLPPMEDGGVYKLGRTIPVKIALYLADGSPAADAVVTLWAQMLSAGEPSGDPVEVSSTSAADMGNTFRYVNGQFIFNLDTDALTVGSWRLTAMADDGTSRSIDIGLK